MQTKTCDKCGVKSEDTLRAPAFNYAEIKVANTIIACGHLCTSCVKELNAKCEGKEEIVFRNLIPSLFSATE